MKNCQVILLLILVTFSSFGQSGPGGVGNSSSIRTWTKADFNIFQDAGITSVTNGNTVQQWNDLSGNGNHLIQSSPSLRPTFLTNQINGLPAIDFSNIGQFLQDANTGSNLTNTEVIVVGRFDQAIQGPGDFDYMINVGSTYLDGISISRSANSANYYSYTESNFRAGGAINNNFHILNQSFTGTAPFHFLRIDGTPLSVAAHNAQINIGSAIRIGSMQIGGIVNPLDGKISEVILMDNNVNSTGRIIIENYLSSKYSLTIPSDKFTSDATHPNELAGIGQEAPGDNHTDAQGTAIVRIQGASDLGTGEYLIWGHDGAGLTADAVEIPAAFGGTGNKLTREWVADETGGDVGTVDITFDISSIVSLGPDPSNYRILTDTDGDFTNANVNAAILPVVVGSNITFNNVDLSTEKFFTIANTADVTDCITDGIGFIVDVWTTAAGWDCAVVPDSTKNVLVDVGFTRTLSGVQTTNDLAVDGTLILAANSTLVVKGNMSVTGTLTCNSGSTIIFRGNSGSLQTVNNSTGGTITFANVQVANSNNVRFLGSPFAISDGLHLIKGSFQNTSGLTFTSNATTQGHIARVITGNFSGAGSFTVQRFKVGGSADWNDLATAGIATTVSDIDQEIFISGVPGADGYAAASGGGGFISMWTYNNSTDAYTPVTNVTNPMALGQGFETWLGDNLTTWNSKAWNFTGSTINIATSAISLDGAGTRWNLIGNPLPCFLNFTAINTNTPQIVGDEFWYYDADSAQFNSRGVGAFIPPGQGFWVNVSSSTTMNINPATDIFSDRNTSEWFKTAPKEEFKVEVKNKDIPFGSAVFLRKDASAFSGKDDMDLAPLKVPDSRAVNMWMDYVGEESMVNYVDPSEEHIEIPLVIESGVPGEFIMNFKGLNKFNEYQCKNLLNLQTNEQIEIVSGASYSFKIGEDLSALNFKLLLSKADYEDCLAPTDFTDNSVKVFASQKTIVADFFLDRSAEVKIDVYNVLGQQVYTSSSVESYSRKSINLNDVQSGVYFVNLNINGTTKTEKVILN